MTRVSAERVAYGGGQGTGQDTRIQMTVVLESEQWIQYQYSWAAFAVKNDLKSLLEFCLVFQKLPRVSNAFMGSLSFKSSSACWRRTKFQNSSFAVLKQQQ